MQNGSRQSSANSSKRSAVPKSAASPLNTLMQLHPLLPKRFPTLFELVDMQIHAASPGSSNQSGLFCNLVGRPEIMFDDLLRNPEKYAERDSVSAILQSLIS